MDSRFRSPIIVLLLILLLLGYGNGQTSSRTLAINDWSGSWEFTGFGIGPSSGDYYHVLSSADVNQCAIIRETTSNVVSWAKLYTNSQCAGLSFDPVEDNAYIANKEASYLGLYLVYTCDGSATNHLTETTMNISGGITTIVADQYRSNVMLAGNIMNNAGESCAGVANGTDFNFQCSSSEVYLGGYINSKYSWYFSRTIANGEVHLRCYNVSTGNAEWFTSINLTSSSEVIDSTKTQVDSSYFYLAAQSSNLGSIFIGVFDLSNGSIVNTIKQRSSSQQLKIGSFKAPNTNNSITYLSLYSSTGTYSELIKLYFPSSDYIIYQQQCIKFRFQHVFSNETWISLQQTQHIHSALVPSMGSIMDTVMVTQLTNSGLEVVSISNSTSTSGFTPSNTSGSFNTSVTASYSNLNYTFSSFVAPTEECQTNTTETNIGNTTDDDDSISTLSIVLIIVCSVLFIINMVGIVMGVTYCIKKSKIRNEGMSKIEEFDNPAEERDSLREENKA